MKHPQFRRHAHGDRAGHSPAPGVRRGRSRDVPRRYIKAPKRRYIDTSIRRYVVHMFAARPRTRTSGRRSGGTPSNVDRLTTRFLNFSDGRDARPRANIIAIACAASPVDKRDRSNEPITVNLPSKRGAQVEGAASEAIAPMPSAWCPYVRLAGK
ncbi:hypothetical protein [Burkholderia pseudomallei]|uniref:hypothetical protein n=2 Tax=Burkholderia pseudomallei TaxID=28450 RepID=UPI001EF1B29A|nr:hypothetical protein [Burkholderia pseudomallei]